jgi:hypothetical protein
MARPYNRREAVSYAHQWAYGRNPAYYDFEHLGGDCTNFASQVLFAGSQVMNYSSNNGWYYTSLNNRSPSWAGVNELYRFLVNNRGKGPHVVETSVENIRPGDIIQLSFVGNDVFNHSPVVVSTGSPPSLDNIRIAAHTDDRDYYPITRYHWVQIRFLHVVGVGD